MAKTLSQKLLTAIQYDDVYAFGDLTEKTPCGKLRIGRFPVLSLLYLYKAKRILSVYENEFIKISAWEDIGGSAATRNVVSAQGAFSWEAYNEPVDVVRRFSAAAGKCLRLYFYKIVSPLEMLLILDKHKRLKKLYPLAKPSEAVKARLKSVYYIKYALNVSFEGDNIIIDKKPLSRRTKQKIIALAVGGFALVSAAVAVPVSVVSYLRKYEGQITSLSQIDFLSNKTYTLKSDITIPANYSVSKFNCRINGDGHKLIFEKNSSLGALNGALSGVQIQTFGNPIFTVCAKGSALSDVTVHVVADVNTDKDSAFIALTNYGTFSNVTMNVLGSVSAFSDREGDADNQTELVFGGMVKENGFISNSAFGTIKNCSATYSDFTLDGVTKANATFGGIVGTNNGVVQDCAVSGNITSDTFDLGGVCYVNNNTVTKSINRANLSQTSDDKDWTPLVGGIAVDNLSTVEYCQSSGNLSASGAELAIVGGIAARTDGQNNYCYTEGELYATSKTAYVGGIFGMSQTVSDGRYVYFGFANNCLSRAKLSASLGDGVSCVGGIGGYVQETAFNQYYYDEFGFLISQIVYLGGGIIDSVFLGEITGEFSYYGAVVGVCGIYIYEANAFTSDGVTRRNFDGNYYLDNGTPSFGAAITPDGEPVRVDGKGITSATEDEITSSETYKEIIKKIHN
ncbi:MAG: hypothetical protein J1F71_05115 [Clostridiales bacterium]|nr:hypothetical protein [Clostridiales bacterium]